MTLAHRPCGACRALVEPYGCPHWKHPRERQRRRERVEYADRKSRMIAAGVIPRWMRFVR